MLKKVIFIGISLLFLSAFIFFTAAQSPQLGHNNETISREPQLLNRGSNFETLCLDTICDTAVYSYDKYFKRNGAWEQVDENWDNCEEGFCTNDYYFQAIADSSGLVRMQTGNSEFIQQISSFGNEAVNISEAPTIDGSILTYQDILPNIDLKYQYLPHKLKEELVIKEPLQSVEQDFDISFNLEGDARFSLEPPFICDSRNNCRPLDYNSENGRISLTIPSRFLLNESTVYPVVIDPSFTLDNTSIIWNGYIESPYKSDCTDCFPYRIVNPASFNIGSTEAGDALADIDWNLDSATSVGTIKSATLRLFVESLIAPNFINITQLGKNSSEWPDNATGNVDFRTDISNGTVYANATFSPDLANTPYDFVFNQNGISDLTTALNSDRKFSTGINTLTADGFPTVISARDNPNPSQRPILIISHTRESFNFTYDANGNMIQGFGKYMEYDGWNRLSKIRDTNSTGVLLAEYFYDHEGKRILKRAYNISGNGHNESTYYMNTRPADFIQVVNTNGTIINETYIYLQDKLIAKIDTNGRKFFYHPDNLGSTSLVTNESGDVVEDLLYLPYGDILSGTEISRFGYTGQENDLESGFMDYGARQYNPQFGRFLQPDPVIADVYNPQSLNRYSYVLNNPYKYTDPTGEIFDIVLDVGFIGYDIYTIIRDPHNSANYIALAADAGGAILPGVTGLGIAVRTAKAADKALELATTADKIANGVNGVKAIENAKEIEKVAKLTPGEIGKLKDYQKTLTETGEVTVGNFKEANDLRKMAFPDAQKVPGAGPSMTKAGDSLFKGTNVYKTDYLIDPSTGKIFGHGNLPSNHPHANNPHINIKSGKNKFTIIINKFRGFFS